VPTGGPTFFSKVREGFLAVGTFEPVLEGQTEFGCAENVRRNSRRRELCEQRHKCEEGWSFV